MGRFVRHIPCPKCGSRDNRAVYDDGSEWCFGCHDLKRATRYMYQEVEEVKAPVHIISTLETKVPEPNRSWLKKYLTDDQIDMYFYWSPKMKRHVYLEWRYKSDDDNEGEMTYWEARKVFGPNESTSGISKVISSGSKPYSMWGKWKETGVVVMVEDIVSAIKLSDLVGVMCLHGSSLPWPMYQRLGNNPAIKKVIIWLDPDKFPQAQAISSKFHSWNKETSVIRTPEDPKDYPLEEIKEILKGAI